MNINCPQVHWQQIPKLGQIAPFSSFKIYSWVSWKQVRPAEKRTPACTRFPIGSPSLSGSMWGHFGLSPPVFFLLLSSIPTSLPFHTLIGVPEPREEGRRGRGGSQGQSLFLFGSLGLGEAWRENGCIRAEVGGQDFNSVKEQLVWVSAHAGLPSLSPQIQGDEKFVQRGTSKIKKVYGPKPLPLPCSSIREECNNVSIWPHSHWLKTRKSFLCLGVLTAGWNLIKKLQNSWGIFSYLKAGRCLPLMCQCVSAKWLFFTITQVGPTFLVLTKTYYSDSWTVSIAISHHLLISC